MMSHPATLPTAIALLLATSCPQAPRAQSSLPEYVVPPTTLGVTPVRVREEAYTVLTMAPDGSWGAATSVFIGDAISGAMADCKSMSGPTLGCGYMWKTIQVGWVLGVHCGTDNILVAEKVLANAELAAFNRETELRQVYRKNLAPCARVVTIDPDGLVSGSRTRSSTPKLAQDGFIRD